MQRVLLNLDGGEYDAEPEELYALADVVHVACGGHAGNARSMERVVRSCVAYGTRIGAHPSYVDREGFGRRALVVAPGLLEEQIAEQCAALRAVAEANGACVASAKPHGALYHAAHADSVVARACVAAITRTLGQVAIVGLAGGALEAAARSAGHPYLSEAFADRGVRADGSLIPRGEPGAVTEDPVIAAARAQELLEIGSAATLCVHADTPTALAIARAVRRALDERPTAFGDDAVRFALPEGTDRTALLAELAPVARDVVLAENVGLVVAHRHENAATLAADVHTPHQREHAASVGADASLGVGPVAALAADVRAVLARPRAPRPRSGAEHVVRVVYDGEDLDEVARAIGKDRAAVIALHADRAYDVTMLGFLPGFAYLRAVAEPLRLPRRAPRTRVPAGSVAIAADYTGIYPFASPGGWHLLGRAVDFEPFADNGAKLAFGDTVRFEAVDDGEPTRAQSWELPSPTGPHLEVVRAAGLALVVDGGRPGHMHEGVPPGGPLVRALFDRANAFAGNVSGAGAIELSGTIELVARGALAIADDDGLTTLADGDRYVLSTTGRTRVRYLTLRGGVDAPLFLGSRCALPAIGVGRPLRKGDRIGASDQTGHSPAPAFDDETPIFVREGPDPRGLDLLLAQPYRISSASDRTGTRLEGPALSSDAGGRSTPMVLGAIELTPSGLIVLGPDHPTTGGYPVVAVLDAASRDAFFARPIGSAIRFAIR